MPSLLKILTDPGDFPFYGGGEFKQKKLPYNSVAAGGDSAQPAIVKPIPEGEARGSSNPDFLLRGGNNWLSARGDDVARISKFFATPEGLGFAIKQNLLPVILPSVSQNGNTSITYNATNAAEIFSQINNNAYSPLSTLAQVAVGVNGIYFDRSVTGIKTKTYSSINNVVSPTPVGQNYSIKGDTVSNLKSKTIPTEVQKLNENAILEKISNTYSDTNKFTSGSRESTYTLSHIIKKAGPSGSGQPTIGVFDPITQTSVLYSTSGNSNGDKIKELQGKDLVEFSIQVINNNTPSLSDYIFFRAYLDSLTDSFSATWDPYKFVGRGESFYTYSGFTRGVNLNFKIFCGEDPSYISPTYEKLNYLVSTLTPDYSSVGYARGNLIKLTIGNYMKNLPGFLTNLSFNIPTDYGWDVTGTKKPTFIDVTSFSFTPIHTNLPRKGTSLIQ